MPKKPKEIEVIFEPVDAPPEEIEERISVAFRILFDETMKFMKAKKKSNNL